MEIQRYLSGALELSAKGYVPDSWIFDYSNEPLLPLYERFYKFCQDNLEGHNKEFDILPATFFFKRDNEVNAAAGKIDDDSIIFINYGTLDTLYQTLYNHNKAFTDDPYLKSSYNILPDDLSPDFIMYQITIQFTYYHELTHVIQRSPIMSKFVHEAYAGNASGYDRLQHIHEFDADLYATQMIYFHIYEFWKKMSVADQTAAALGKLIALYLSGMLFYFNHLTKGVRPMYFDEGDHPHPVIRITYIMDIILDVAKRDFDQLGLDSKSVLREAFHITERICDSNGTVNIVDRYAQMFVNFHDGINNYVNGLIRDSDPIPYLVKNRS